MDGEAAPHLTIELLEELREAWARAGAPIAGKLGPGASHDQIETEFAKVDLTPPSEAYVFWGWANGLVGGLEAFNEFGPGPMNAKLLSVAEAREWTEGHRDDLQIENFWSNWQPSWFALTSGLAIDTIGPEETSPVHLTDWMQESDPEPILASLGQLVKNWTWSLDNHKMWFDTDTQRWEEEGLYDLQPTGAWGGW